MGEIIEASFLWQHEFGSRWINYGEKHLLSINKAYVKGKKTVTLPDKDPKKEIVLNFDQMYQKNKISGWEQRIRCCIYNESFYVWLWKDDDGNWNSYIPAIAVELELNYKAGEDFKFYYKNDYVFKVEEMIQKNLNSGTKRDVKREKVAVKMIPHIQTIADSFKNVLNVKTSVTDADAPSAKRIKVEPNGNPVMACIFKSNVPVDPVCTDLAAIAHVYCDEDGVYDAMLNLTNLEQNNNKFYRMQLLREKYNEKYYVWLHWGRVGKKGQSNLIPFHTSVESAKKEFFSKFNAKTKNEWSSRDEFKKYPGKYELLKIDYESKCSKNEIAISQPQCQLHPKIKSLLEMISNVDEVQKRIIEMKFDIKKSPLGKLTEEQIKAGYSALKRIESLVKNDSQLGSKLLEACNDFYTKIPHDFGMKTPPIISTLEGLKEKLELLEALSDIEISMQIQNDQKKFCEENPIDFLYKMLKCDLKYVESSNNMYKVIDSYLKHTHGPSHNHYTMEIVDVYECRRHKEERNFLDFGNKYLLWHGSRLSNFVGILKNGLKISPPEAPCTGYMFGKGVYFADISSKSANYCYPTKFKNEGLLVLCEVSLGEQNILYSANYCGDVDTKKKKKHSVKAIGKVMPNPKDFLVIDGVTIPRGKPILTEDKMRLCELNYNEYVVYNTNQVKVRYLIHTRFHFK